MENVDFSVPLTLNLSLNQYDTLVESVAKASGLTQVILTHTSDNFENIAPDALYNFLLALDDLIYKANSVCRAMKPQSN